MGKKIDLTGQVFGRLTVMSECIIRVNTRIQWECRCDCGNITTVYGNDLRRGKTTSCGCFKIENQTKHNSHHHELYQTWYHMIERCTKPLSMNYENYGARGISVCSEWLIFSTFLYDMGSRPNGYTLDRIDNNGDYNKDNCRWANSETQCNNRRSSRYITYNNKTQTISQWNNQLFGNNYIINNRLQQGWSEERALTTPVGR